MQSDIGPELQRILLQKIATRTLELPSMRTSVLRAVAVLGKKDFSFREVAQVIEQDPVLVGRILWVSNSAAFGGVERAKTVLSAITRLGASNLKTILFEAAVNQVFESSDRRITAASRGLWTHSRAVGILAREIAERALVEDTDGAYLGGLLHDIGKPVVASLLLRSERRLLGAMTETWFDPNTWLDLVQSIHRPVGIALANEWRLPEALVGAISTCNEYDEASPRSASNCIRFANAVAKDQGFYVGSFDHEANDGALRVGQLLLGLETAEVNRLRESLGERLASAYAAG